MINMPENYINTYDVEKYNIDKLDEMTVEQLYKDNISINILTIVQLVSSIVIQVSDCDRNNLQFSILNREELLYILKLQMNMEKYKFKDIEIIKKQFLFVQNNIGCNMFLIVKNIAKNATGVLELGKCHVLDLFDKLYHLINGFEMESSK